MDGNGFKMRARSEADAKLMAAEMDLDAQRLRRRWSAGPTVRHWVLFVAVVVVVLLAAGVLW